jgi:hypothetical protein
VGSRQVAETHRASQVIRSKGLYSGNGRFQTKELPKTHESFASFAKELLISRFSVRVRGGSPQFQVHFPNGRSLRERPSCSGVATGVATQAIEGERIGASTSGRSSRGPGVRRVARRLALLETLSVGFIGRTWKLRRDRSNSERSGQMERPFVGLDSQGHGHSHNYRAKELRIEPKNSRRAKQRTL